MGGVQGIVELSSQNGGGVIARENLDFETHGR
jgi:hypothetical protein